MLARNIHAGRHIFSWVAGGLVTFVTCSLAGSPAIAQEVSAAKRIGQPADVDFNRHIRPILVKKCFSCHGPDEASREGGLGLHDRQMALAELDSGELGIVPGDAEASEVLRRIISNDKYERMPPEETAHPLTSNEIKLIRAWINSGAEYEVHWSFKTISKPQLPTVSRAAWIRNPVDAFILSRIEKTGLEPAAEATRERLLRRLSLDLIGLPATPKEIDKFVNDKSADAYEKQVDRLLAAQQLGEHWAGHWLDLARYADSQGYAQDEIRTIWPYRDWVIRAINDDMPFDQFTIEQLAGDLLPNPTTQQLVATGFHRNTMTNTEGGTDDEEFRHAAVVDRTNTTAQVWLGLTMGCAQCHSHKFDPITHQDYYRFFAIFNQTIDSDQPDNRPTIAYVPSDQRKQLQQLSKRLAKLVNIDADRPEDLERLEAEIGEIKKRVASLQIYRTPVMREMSKDQQRKSYLAIRGNYLSHGVEVEPTVPRFLSRSSEQKLYDRLDLAKWLTSPDHPLTARVAANRIWAQLFGAGIVDSSEDFGSQGNPPSHPRLLDWLASSLKERGWSRKQLCKTIVMSATYRQASRISKRKLEVDPFNRLLSRGARYRLSAEQIRDSALAAAGLLSAKMYGPPVKPPQPKSGQSAAFGGSLDWEASPGEDRYRRAIYTLWRRTNPYPSFMALDATDRKVCITRRIRTNTPVASFVTMNDPAFVEAAVATAQRVVKLPDGAARVEYAFRLIVGRSPSQQEQQITLKLLDQQLEHYGNDVEAAKELVQFHAPAANTKGEAAVELAAFTIIANTLLNLDEVLTRN